MRLFFFGAFFVFLCFSSFAQNLSSSSKPLKAKEQGNKSKEVEQTEFVSSVTSAVIEPKKDSLEASSEKELDKKKSFPAENDLIFPATDSANLRKIPESDPLSTAVNILCSFAFIITLMLALSWYLQNKGVCKGSDFGRTLCVIPLDHKHFIYIVNIVGKILVLGVTDHQINLLCEITDQSAIDELNIKSSDTSNKVGVERIFSIFSNAKKNLSGNNEPFSEIMRHVNIAKNQIDDIKSRKESN
ncbi:MAG: FliO/MopB family protein [Candidatus Riflebacteria bacterium]|nr:FliO/MopB family protein [Candidatus Riflebacteria bacterium]